MAAAAQFSGRSAFVHPAEKPRFVWNGSTIKTPAVRNNLEVFQGISLNLLPS
jgi:hypothetical protein